MKTLLVLALSVISYQTVSSNNGNNFSEIWNSFKNYENKTMELLKVFKTDIEKKKKDSLTFFTSIETSPIMEYVRIFSGHNCSGHVMKLEAMKTSFDIHMNLIEIPISKRIIEIQEVLEEVSSKLLFYQSLAEVKLKQCALNGSECEQQVANDYSENVQSILCRIESNCSIHNVFKRSIDDYSTCGSNQFQCNNRQCIDNAYVCNGGCSCNDCSDEPSGCTRYCFNKFHCKNLKCIHKNLVCNSVDDCGDGSDEAGCPVKRVLYNTVDCSLKSGKYLCDNKECIGLSHVCNEVDDCGDGSDEGSLCGKLECDPSCSAAGGVCFGTPKGSVCLNECPPGTSETANGCLPGPRHPPLTLNELLSDFPRLLKRYIAGSKLIQKRILESIYSSTTALMQCLGGEYSTFSQVVALNNIQKPSVTTTTESSEITSSILPYEYNDE